MLDNNLQKYTRSEKLLSFLTNQIQGGNFTIRKGKEIPTEIAPKTRQRQLRLVVKLFLTA